MAAFFDDKPLVAGINEDWDEQTTGHQIMRPEWDFSPILMRTMHHLPQIFFDTLRPERPDCPVLIPSSFARSRDRVISQDIYSYEPCGLPTGNFMPAEQAQIRLMTASPITLRACIPAPDQVTPEQAYFKDLDFYKKTLFHTPFLSRGRAVTVLEYRDAKVVFEVDDWFRTLPQAVQRYLLPLRSMYAKWYDENVRDLTQNYSYCILCKTNRPTFSAIICNTTLVGPHPQMLRKVSRSSPESSRFVPSRETYTKNYNVCFLQLRKKISFEHRDSLQRLD